MNSKRQEFINKINALIEKKKNILSFFGLSEKKIDDELSMLFACLLIIDTKFIFEKPASTILDNFKNVLKAIDDNCTEWINENFNFNQETIDNIKFLHKNGFLKELNQEFESISNFSECNFSKKCFEDYIKLTERLIVLQVFLDVMRYKKK